MPKPNTIKIDDVEYIRADSVQESQLDNEDYVIIRSKDSGVHAGYLISSTSKGTVELKSVRRLWYWSGAASLSELAVSGVKNPGNCKFPCVVEKITVFGVCEIIPATKKARLSIEAVPIWKA